MLLFSSVSFKVCMLAKLHWTKRDPAGNGDLSLAVIPRAMPDLRISRRPGLTRCEWCAAFVFGTFYYQFYSPEMHHTLSLHKVKILGLGSGRVRSHFYEV